jgi:hypothetical protein
MATQNLMALALTNVTATTNGHDLENLGGRFAHVVINITAITGTAPTATFTVQGKDAISGSYYTILASTALNTAATTVLRIGPGLTAAANLVANDVIPKTFRVIMTAGGTITDLDATVGVSLV